MQKNKIEMVNAAHKKSSLSPNQRPQMKESQKILVWLLLYISNSSPNIFSRPNDRMVVIPKLVFQEKN